jgi:excisionase family DNA binding protein
MSKHVRIVEKRATVPGERRETMSTLSTSFAPQLLKPSEVALLLRVSRSTVNNWIHQERVPYLELPGGDYRIPLRGLMLSLKGNLDLTEALHVLEDAARDAGLGDAALVVAAGGDPTEE